MLLRLAIGTSSSWFLSVRDRRAEAVRRLHSTLLRSARSKGQYLRVLLEAVASAILLPLADVRTIRRLLGGVTFVLRPLRPPFPHMPPSWERRTAHPWMSGLRRRAASPRSRCPHLLSNVCSLSHQG